MMTLLNTPVAGLSSLNSRLPTWWRTLVIAVLITAVALVSNSLYRNKTADLQHHPDEIIPIRVLQTMHAHGDLNTDWARADLPDDFKACRYNFSGYVLASYFAISTFSPESFDDERTLLTSLQRLSRLASMATLCLVFWLLARNAGLLFGLGGAAAVLVTPQLYQDAHYARPEALATLVFTGCFALACAATGASAGRRKAIGAVISLAVGFLFSIKITYVAAAVLLAPVMLDEAKSVLRTPAQAGRLSLWAAIFCALGVFGFYLGAPAAFADPHGFMEGIAALKQQYSGFHPPHSPPHGDFLGQSQLFATYYLATLGAPLLILHLFGYASSTLKPAKFAYAALTLALTGLFLANSVFFERNLSLLLPSFIIISMVGASSIAKRLGNAVRAPLGTWIQLAAGLALIAVSIWIPARTTVDLHTLLTRKGFTAHQRALDERIGKVSAELNTTPVNLPWVQVLSQEYPDSNGCHVYVFDDFGDYWSKRYVDGLPPTFRQMDVIPSLFAQIPTSTLHTYHDSTRHVIATVARCTGYQLTGDSK